MLPSESDPVSLQILLTNKDLWKDSELQHRCSYVRGREGSGRGRSCSEQQLCMSCSVWLCKKPRWTSSPVITIITG